MELFVEGQLPVALPDHHQPGLVVDALLGPAAEVPEGRVVHADERARVDRPGGKPHVHQPGIGEDEDHEIDGRRTAGNHDSPELAGIHLALDSGNHVQHRLVIAVLLERGGLLEPGNVPSHRPDRHRQVRMLLLEFAVDLHRAQARKRLHEVPDELPMGIKELAPFAVALTGLDLLVGHGQVFPDCVAGDPQPSRNATDGHPRAFVM